MALTGGDSMPEYRSFEPVATTNMVNNFNGAFTYNIPLMNVPNGYPINLSYHSGEVNNEALASWVGLGWNINPGSIVKMKRGFPDEYNNATVTYFNKMEKNWTVSIGSKPANMEAFGLLSVGVGATLSYNNYNGLGTRLDLNLGVAGVANLNLSSSNGRFGMSPSINPMAILSAAKKIKAKKQEKDRMDKNQPNDDDKRKMEVLKDMEAYSKGSQDRPKYDVSLKAKNDDLPDGEKPKKPLISNPGFTVSSVESASYPTSLAKYDGRMVSIQVDAGMNFTSVPIDVESQIFGSYTVQKNQPVEELSVFGYKYSEGALSDPGKLMDYSTENENPFSKRENVLGYPLPNYDVYSLTGESFGGSFRAMRGDYGHYRKNYIKSEDYNVDVGADVNIASIFVMPPNPAYVSNLESTAGGSTSYGYHYTTIGDWKGVSALPIATTKNKFLEEGDFNISGEKYFLSFDGDKAGYYDLTTTYPSSYADPVFNDNPFKVSIPSSGTVSFSGYSGAYKVDKRVGVANDDNELNNKHKKRSTYISETLVEDFPTTWASDKVGKFEKRTSIFNNGTRIQYDHNQSGYNQKSIAELVSTNTDGVKYVYGLPVYARNEQQLTYSFDLANNDLDETSFGEEIIPLVNSSVNENETSRKLGYTSSTPYASAHLLTQILSPDYIDRTGDGPTPDDFGSYTRLYYQRAYGGASASTWYPYRSPYAGVTLDRGSLSSKMDDMGSFSSGEKEVYYLYAMASKTHIAIFNLNDGDRKDGLGVNIASTSLDAENYLKAKPATTSNPNQGAKLRYLKNVELYNITDIKDITPGSEDFDIKSATGNNNRNPIKTVWFEYNYGLAQGTPNNSDYASTSSTERGKLTLKKVWTESAGKIRSRIAPYVFHYDYPTSNPYPTPYEFSEINNLYLNQNPDYDPRNTDRWGNYMDYQGLRDALSVHGGNAELARFWPYVNQNAITLPGISEGYDPAAYALKRISLPTGGEIHVHYEQHDYNYVQNKVATIMVPLLDAGTTSHDEKKADKKYYLNLDAIGIYQGGWTATEYQALAHQLFEAIRVERKRMYYNFLYGLVNDADHTKNTSDYISGYARIDGYGYDPGNGIFFMFKKNGGTTLPAGYTAIPYGGKASTRELPRKSCKYFYKSQRRLKVDGSSNELDQAGSSDNIDGEKIGNAFTKIANMAEQPLTSKCKDFDPAMSYVKLQVPNGNFRRDPYTSASKHYSKLGGGFRVKRILTFDAIPLGSGAIKSLYGSEYEYTTKRNGVTISSGVATNEPNGGRKENVLVDIIPKDEQSDFNAIIHGRDVQSQEGPLGEGILPAPSIGYSRVLIRNIHEGITNTGTEEYTFYTVKDYPVVATASEVTELYNYPLPFSAQIGPVSVSYNRKTPHVSQGYSFVSYDMNGKPKTISKYLDKNTTIKTASEIYEYFEPDDDVTVMGNNRITKTRKMAEMGRTVEILSEPRQVADYTFSGTVSVDVSIGGPMVSTTAGPTLVPAPISTNTKGGGAVVENVLRSHVTSKIIKYPSLLKKVTRTVNGISSESDNLVFDDNTGDPVVVLSKDDFHGTYLSQDFKGSWEYPNLRSKFYNQNLIISGSGITFDPGTANDPPTIAFDNTNGACGELTKFVRGDMLAIKISSTDYYYHVDEVDYVNNLLNLQLSKYTTSPPSASTVASIKIVESGYKNQLSTKIGNITYFDKDGTPAYIEGLGNYITNTPFLADLNNALKNYDGTSTAPISLGGTYGNMNVEKYYGWSATLINREDFRHATIKNVELEASYAGGKVTLKLKSFDIESNGTDYSIEC